MDHILVTPEMLNSGANSCDETATTIESDLADLRNYVTGLQGTWHGIAAKQFDQLMHDFDTFGNMLHNALTDIGNGLRTNYVNYVETETSNINSLISVNQDIPGAYL